MIVAERPVTAGAAGPTLPGGDAAGRTLAEGMRKINIKKEQ